MSNKFKNKNYIEDLIFDSDLDFANSAETDLLIREEAKYLAQELILKDKIKVSEELANNSLISKINKLEEDNLKNMEEIKKNNESWEESMNILSRIENKIQSFGKEIEDNKNTNSISNEKIDHNFTPVVSKDNLNEKSSIEIIKNTLVENNENLKKVFENFANQVTSILSMNNNYTFSKQNKVIDELDEWETLDIKDNINIENTSNDLSFEIEELDLFSHNLNSNNVNLEKNIEQKFEIKPIEWNDDFEKESTPFSKNVDSNELDLLKNRQNELLNDQTKINKEIEIIKQSINDFILSSEYSNKNIIEQTIDNAHKLTLDVNDVKEQYSNLENEINKIYSTWLENNKLLSNLENLLFELNSKNDELVFDKISYDEEIHKKTIDNEKFINELSKESNDLKETINSLNERLSIVESLSSTFNPKDYVNNNLTETMVEEVKNISKNIIETELENRNLLKIEDIMTRERVIDEVMESDIFNYSLEKKIQQIIIDEKINNKINESDKLEILSYTINSDKFKNIIASEVNYVSNDIKLELNDRFTKLRDDFHNTNCYNSNKFIEIESKLDSRSDQLQKHEIIEMVFASRELENIINDKLIYVVNNELDSLKESISEIENKILRNIKHYLDEDLQENLKKEVIESKDLRQKIKNDALNAIYNEIQERDKQFDSQKKEILKNYEALIQNNRILEHLEKLVLKQVEEVEGFKKDKENSLDIIIDKINVQKIEIDYLKEKIKDITGKELIQNINSNNVDSLDVYENIKNMTSSLVRDEIKKLNLINASKENVEPMILSDEPSSNFFKNRIKDILNKLEESYDPVSSLGEKIPLTNEFKVDLSDLKIDINKLKEEKKDSHHIDEDLGWFYEKEFENHKEEKEKQYGLKDFISSNEEFDQDLIEEMLKREIE